MCWWKKNDLLAEITKCKNKQLLTNRQKKTPKTEEWWRTPNEHILRTAEMMRSFSRSYMKKLMWEHVSKKYRSFCSLIGFTYPLKAQSSKKVKSMTENKTNKIFPSFAWQFRSNGWMFFWLSWWDSMNQWEWVLLKYCRGNLIQLKHWATEAIKCMLKGKEW